MLIPDITLYYYQAISLEKFIHKTPSFFEKISAIL